MAHGDVVYATGRSTLVLLLDAAPGTTDGVWIDCAEYGRGIATLVLGGSTVEVDLSNAATRPANNTHGLPAAAAGAVDGLLSILITPRWVKARVTGFVAAATVALLLRAEP